MHSYANHALKSMAAQSSLLGTQLPKVTPMNIPADKLLHLKYGAALALLLLALSLIAIKLGPHWAIGVGGWVLAWGVERYQAIRREGTASRADMVASALPATVLAFVVWVVLKQM